MANKPTKEELEAKEEEAKKAADELEGRQSIPEDSEDEEPEMDVESNEEGEEEESNPEEEESEEQAEPSKELYKEKFSASSRENQRINAKNRILNQAIQEAQDIPEPTEEEMKSQYGDDWDLMSDVDKKLIKETEVSKRWRQKIKEASDQATKIEKWNESVDEFIKDPKTLNENPDLEGKENDFHEYATLPEHNNVPFSVLVPAFLHQKSTQKVSHKGRMFEKGSGGPNDKPASQNGKISIEKARQLRETDYTTYKEYLKKGLIDLSI